MRKIDSLEKTLMLEGIGAGGEGDDRGWDGWMASQTRWTWVWVNSGSWWWTGRPGVLWFMGSQRVRHDWVTELNWTEPLSAAGAILWEKMNKPFGQPNTSALIILYCLSYMKLFSWIFSLILLLNIYLNYLWHFIAISEPKRFVLFFRSTSVLFRFLISLPLPCVWYKVWETNVDLSFFSSDYLS